MKKSKVILLLVPITTFLLGYLSFIVLSEYYKVLWINSEYDIPLVYNMSVMIGDAILLPIINYRVCNLYFNLIDKKHIKKYFLYWFIGTGIISLLLNITTHMIWVNDEFTDFIAIKVGDFSIIGYWHLIFSFIEVIIILLYPFLWYRSIVGKNKIAIEYSKKTWIYFFLFTVLGSFDMLNKYLFVYNDSLVNTMKNEVFPFITITVAVSIFYYMKKMEKITFNIIDKA